jgi:hypothetical protein
VPRLGRAAGSTIHRRTTSVRRWRAARSRFGFLHLTFDLGDASLRVLLIRRSSGIEIYAFVVVWLTADLRERDHRHRADAVVIGDVDVGADGWGDRRTARIYVSSRRSSSSASATLPTAVAHPVPEPHRGEPPQTPPQPCSSEVRQVRALRRDPCSRADTESGGSASRRGSRGRCIAPPPRYRRAPRTSGTFRPGACIPAFASSYDQVTRLSLRGHLS